MTFSLSPFFAASTSSLLLHSESTSGSSRSCLAFSIVPFFTASSSASLFENAGLFEISLIISSLLSFSALSRALDLLATLVFASQSLPN